MQKETVPLSLGPVEFDESAKAYAMNIGVPVRNADTGEVIGVLRGTLDISVLLNALRNIDVSGAGTIDLVDAQGIILFSETADKIMQPLPNDISELLRARKGGWQKISAANGKAELVAYSSSGWELGTILGWRLIITQDLGELRQYQVHNLIFGLLASLCVLGTGMIVTALIIKSSVALPLALVTKMGELLSSGDLVRDLSDQEKDRIRLRKDEIGAIGQAFDGLITYLQEMGLAAASIADKDLTVNVRPRSEKDELGNAFAGMVSGLRAMIGQLAESVHTTSSAANQLAIAAEQSGEATGQIATTLQQVALGTAQQTAGVHQTSASVEEMNCAIKEVAEGAQEQGKAINTTSALASRISTAIDQVADHAQVVAHDSVEAARYSSEGAKTIEATIAGMQMIKTKVGLSAQKVREMGQRSDQIGTILETIDKIASQTNLLALNAAIEAARVQTQGEKTVERLLQQHMLGAVSLLADMLASGQDLSSEDLGKLARLAQVQDFCISDSDGVIVASNQPSSLGFRFSDDPSQESSVFRPLLARRDGTVIRPVRVRDQDGKPYVYVGVSRRDRPGIVQAGTAADLVYRLGGYSRGFAVVADEVGKLAEHAKSATKEIAVMIRDLQKTVAEAVAVMENGVRDVENESARTTEASASLAAILKAVQRSASK